jgi:ATP/ADP translocase
MFKAKYKQRNIQERMVIALALLCLVACSINVQLYLEHQVVVHTVTYTSKLNHQKNFFDMSVRELMEVMVTSRS